MDTGKNELLVSKVFSVNRVGAKTRTKLKEVSCQGSQEKKNLKKKNSYQNRQKVCEEWRGACSAFMSQKRACDILAVAVPVGVPRAQPQPRLLSVRLFPRSCPVRPSSSAFLAPGRPSLPASIHKKEPTLRKATGSTAASHKCQ